MRGSQKEHRVRDARNAVPKIQTGTCLETQKPTNREEQPMVEEQEGAAQRSQGK